MLNISTEAKQGFPFQERVQAIQKYIQFIEENRAQVLELLTEVATYSASIAEIDSTLKALKGAVQEVEKYQPSLQNQLAVFMPSNVLLYSYALYLIIPSLYVKQIYFRPSTHVIKQMEKLDEMLQKVHPLPARIQTVTQREFIENTVKHSDIVVFTGSYKNAEKVKAQLRKDQLYLFFGQGINPFIIGEDADLSLVVKDVIEARLYNTGQDCMGPDALFVHEKICDPFINMLKEELEKMVFGPYHDPNADYGPIYYLSAIDLASQYFKDYSQYIVYGGQIDYRLRKIESTILRSKLEDHIDIVEFFSPIFNVIEYKSVEQLEELVVTSFFRERSMGASVYGENEMIPCLKKKHTVTVNQTLLDIEDGNEPFGGYGMWANYIYYQGVLSSEPILISKAIADYMQPSGEENETI